MGERELCELVFRPGFSTREVVSELSGRGVGMDVVATRVRADLKGEVLLKSRAGTGTQVTLLLPLTLTIMRALLVRGESHVFAVPLSGVETTTRVLNTEIRGAASGSPSCGRTRRSPCSPSAACSAGPHAGTTSSRRSSCAGAALGHASWSTSCSRSARS